MNFFQAPLFKALFNTDVPRVILKGNIPNFTILHYNQAYKKAAYLEERDVTGMFWWEAFDPETAGGDGGTVVSKALIQSAETHQTVYMPPFSYDILSSDGTGMEKSWWQLEILPVYEEGASVDYLIVSLNDISEQILNQQIIDDSLSREQNLIGELADTNEELADSNKDLNETNEKLYSMNEELVKSQDQLHTLNERLEIKVALRTKELTESEQQFRQLADSIIQMVWITDASGKHEYYNQRWYDFTGSDFEYTKGDGWNHVFHPDDQPKAWDAWNHSLKTGELYEIEYRLRKYTGEYVWVLGRAAPFYDSEGRIVKWFGTCTDIDDLKQLQDRKDDFISIASHELKTPITSLKAALQILERIKDNPASETIPKLVAQATRSVNKVTLLVEDLLNVSRFNQGHLHLNKTVFKVSRLIDDCCNHVRMAGEYSIRNQGDMDLHVYADMERIDQVIINFVNNAVKYAPESKEVLINIEKLGDEAKISVTDKGQGIPAGKLSHLFDRYFRVDNSGVQYSGLGLGLYICAEIVKKHGGQIGVISELGKGSSFWITLPLANQNRV